MTNLPSKQRLKFILAPALHLTNGPVMSVQSGDEWMSIRDGHDLVVIEVTEAIQLRDWLNKVLPSNDSTLIQDMRAKAVYCRRSDSSDVAELLDRGAGEIAQLSSALEAVKLKAVSLADAQVIALHALRGESETGVKP